jgi:DNA-binding MarR family transcriptional regulator
VDREPFGILPGRAAARLARVVDRALADVDLTMPQYRLLVFLSDGTVAASALADWLSVSRPAITTLVDGLVARGLVDRSPVAGDRRRVDHLLTPAGIAALEQADAAVEATLSRLAERLPAPRRRRAVEGLELWGAALDAQRAELLERR